MNARLPIDLPVPASTPRTRRSRVPAARVGWWLLAAGLGGFLLWAALAPLDAGVALEGTVMVTGHRQTVQPPAAGVVAQVRVDEGDQVRRGQVLVELDTDMASAERQAAQAHRAMAAATVARLQAERSGAGTLNAEPALQAAARDDPALAAALALQSQLLQSRALALNARKEALHESLAGVQATLAGHRARVVAQNRRLVLLDERLAALRPLAEHNYVPRNRLLELGESRAALLGERAASESAARTAQSRLGELRAELDGLGRERQRDVEQALAEQRLELARQEQRLAAARYQEAHTRLLSPADGRVVGLKLYTPGAVVGAGDTLMEIVPDDAPLRVEARVPVDRIDTVAAGLPVELMFTAFNRSRTPRVQGRVEQVSADRLEDPVNHRPYYSARIAVPARALRELGDARLQAGMPVQAFVRTGERSLLSYLFKPLLDRLPRAWEGE
tara:strand:+ start:28110 stop:29450 length:1341 start_codon:yes stop_codon:yes gene_type:complete